MLTQRAVVLFAAVAMIVSACKASVEGENKAWTSNTQKIQELTTLYPGYASALSEQKNNAQNVMDSAKSISDEDARAKKMEEANKMLIGGFVSDLTRVEVDIKDIRSKMVEASSTAYDESDRQAARNASEEAQRVVAAAEATLKQGAPNAAAAQTLLRKTASDNQSVENLLDQVISASKDKQKKAEQAKAAEQQAQQGGQAKPAQQQPEAAALWKCEYCGTMNQPAVSKCESCGAPRPQAPAK